MSNYVIDINADVGEGIGNEKKLMPYLSSCNIACGGHAGDLETMRYTAQMAKSENVKIGAHPSFPDKKNFGRLKMEMEPAELYKSLKHQVRMLQTVLDAESLKLNHIKPHGALYNLAAKDKNIARVIIEVVKSITNPVRLYAPFNSEIAKLALSENIDVVYEAFADRNYNDDLSLVSRKKEDAIITDKDQVLNHVLRMVNRQKVRTISGKEVELKASTFCVHGDTENAVEILKYLHQKLQENNIKIQ